MRPAVAGNRATAEPGQGGSFSGGCRLRRAGELPGGGREERGVKYAIRIPANDRLERDIAGLLTRPRGGWLLGGDAPGGGEAGGAFKSNLCSGRAYGATVCAQAGENDRALEWLEEACQERNLPWFISVQGGIGTPGAPTRASRISCAA
jgi:hypothetical protein